MQLQSNHLFAQFSVERAIVSFVLCLAEDRINYNMEILIVYHFVSNSIDFLIVTRLLRKLSIAENVFPEFFELFIKSIGSNHVDYQFDVLSWIFTGDYIDLLFLFFLFLFSTFFILSVNHSLQSPDLFFPERIFIYISAMFYIVIIPFNNKVEEFLLAAIICSSRTVLNQVF